MKKYFLYLSLANFLFLAESYKTQASTQELCEEFVKNMATQKVSSACTYLINNGSDLFYKFSDLQLNELCQNFLTPLSHIAVDQMPQLYFSNNDDVQYYANLTVTIIGAGVALVSVAKGGYYLCKECVRYIKDQDDPNDLGTIPGHLNDLKLELNNLNENIKSFKNNNDQVQDSTQQRGF